MCSSPCAKGAQPGAPDERAPPTATGIRVSRYGSAAVSESWVSDLPHRRTPVPGWMRACMVAWLGLAGPAGATPAGTVPASSTALATEARILQSELPALAGRAASAQQRSAAAQRWFAGEVEFATAFPELIGFPVLDPAWLAARLLALDADGAARAAARVEPIDPGLPAALTARLQAARSETLDAESVAADLERRLLLGLRSGLSRAPGLHAPALATARDALAAARAQLGHPTPRQKPTP